MTDSLIISLHYTALRLQVGQLHFADLMFLPTATQGQKLVRHRGHQPKREQLPNEKAAWKYVIPIFP